MTLLLALGVIIVSGLALYFAQRVEKSSSQRILQDKFQSRISFLLGAQGVREAEISERCRLLAKSVRIQAALEEEDAEDLDAVARIELRDVLAEGNTEVPIQAQDQSSIRPRANFFRFLNADGKLLAPPGPQAKREPWEDELATRGIGPGNQEIGYLTIQRGDAAEIDEVVTTPVLGPEGTRVAALVLGFPPPDPAASSDTDLRTGIWFEGQLQMPSLPVADRQTLAASIAKMTKAPPQTAQSFTVQIHGEPYLLFYKVLNPGSRLAPAYEVCLYSLAESQARQQRTRWKILGAAALVLVLGIAASRLFSVHLSRPVEQLAEISAQNLARREEAEVAREMSEQKYRAIFENAVEGIFLVAPEGDYLSANPAMARIFGYDSSTHFVAEAPGRGGGIYVDAGQWEEFTRRAIAEGMVSSWECEMRRRDGRPIWVSQNARAVRDASGALLHLEGTLEDVTERKEAADSLRTLNAELGKALADLKATQNQVIQQERLRALGQMASGIAHDFNNCLMPITGYSELLLANPETLDDRAKTTQYLETISTAAGDAASIVARLREFYRSNEKNDVLAPVVLSRLMRQAVSLTEPKWKGQAQAGGASIRMIEELGEVPPIAGDESALREVFANLIFNAVDAMPQGGSIALRTRAEGAGVVAEISDTGAGMSEEVRRRCLEPFFTTKGERGTGLGLAMVFGIVQRHGGTLDLQSEPGKGTTFILRFPLRATEPTPGAAAAASLPAQAPLRILLVDDDAQAREVLAAFLEIDGHRISIAENGNEGLRRFQDEPFDLVITDRAMPGMSGPQMAVEIKRITPTMPIVMLSGFNSEDESETLPGIDVVASKPITMPSLREVIQKAMKIA